MNTTSKKKCLYVAPKEILSQLIGIATYKGHGSFQTGIKMALLHKIHTTRRSHIVSQKKEDPISPKTPIITVSLGTKHVGHLQVPSRGQRSTCRQKMKVKVQVQVAMEGVQWTQANRFTGAP